MGTTIGIGTYIGNRSSSQYWSPLNLVATVVSDTAINLTWSGSKVAKIERSTDDISYTQIGTGTNSFSDTGLTADTLYYYRVKGSIYSSVASLRTYTTQYKAVLDEMTIKPSNDLSTAYNTFVKTIVDGGVFGDLDLLNIKAVPFNTNGEAQIDWIHPTNSVALAGTTPPIFSPFSGFVGTADGWIDLGVNPTTATKYTQNSASVFFYKKTIGAIDKYDWGVDDTAASANASSHSPSFKLRYQRVNNNTYSGVDSSTPAISDYSGFWIHNRTASNSYDIWRAKTKLKNHTIASSGLPNKNIYEFATNQATKINMSTAEHSLIGIGAALSDAKIAILSDAIDVLMTNMNASEIYDESKFNNSVVLADYTTFKARSSFSDLEFTFSGTKIYLKANPSLYATYPDYSYLTIYVNGVYNQRVTYSANAYKEIVLPEGLKTVKIVQPLVNLPVATYLGVFINGFKAFSPITYVNPSVSDKIVFVGDSIISGFGTTNPETEGSGRLFTVENNKNTAFHSWGWGSLKQMASDAGKLSATITHIENLFANATGTKRLVVTLGTNDNANDSTDAATFQGWYENLLDAIHVLDVDIDVYCLSPVLRTDVFERSLLDDYRTAINTVCAARSTYCTHIAGKPILSAGDLSDDDVHPNTGGHKKIKDAVYAVMYP